MSVCSRKLVSQLAAAARNRAAGRFWLMGGKQRQRRKGMLVHLVRACAGLRMRALGACAPATAPLTQGAGCAGGQAEARAACGGRKPRRHDPAGALAGADQHVPAIAPGRLPGVGGGPGDRREGQVVMQAPANAVRGTRAAPRSKGQPGTGWGAGMPVMQAPASAVLHIVLAPRRRAHGVFFAGPLTRQGARTPATSFFCSLLRNSKLPAACQCCTCLLAGSCGWHTVCCV